jgi:hypothetical protein
LDYFFRLEDVATVLRQDFEGVLMKPQSKFRDIKSLTNYGNEKLYGLERRIQYLAMNEETCAFTDFKLRELLVEAGWNVFEMKKFVIYIPKRSVDAGVNEHTYKLFTAERDFFIREVAVIKYIKKLYNPQAQSPSSTSSSPDHSLMSDLSQGSLENIKKPAAVIKKTAAQNEGMKVLDGKKKLKEITTPYVPKPKDYGPWGNPVLLETIKKEILEEANKNTKEQAFNRNLLPRLKKLKFGLIYTDYSNSFICKPKMVRECTPFIKNGYLSQTGKEVFNKYKEIKDYFRNDDEGQATFYAELKKFSVDRWLEEKDDEAEDKEEETAPAHPSPNAHVKKTKDIQILGGPLLTAPATQPKKMVGRGRTKTPKSLDINIVKGRSPMKALYKSGDPALHLDRLTSSGFGFNTPLADHNSYFHASPEEKSSVKIDPKLFDDFENGNNFFTQENNENMNHQDDDAGEEMDVDTDFAPSYVPGEKPLTLKQAGKETVAEVKKILKAEKEVNADRLVGVLKPFGYRWNFARLGSNDYFLGDFKFGSKAHFIQHVREELKLTPVKAPPVNSAQKPRQTRSGRVLDNEEVDNHSEQEEEEEVSIVEQPKLTGKNKRKRKDSVSSEPQEERDSAEEQEATQGIKKLKLGDNKIYKGLKKQNNNNNNNNPITSSSSPVRPSIVQTIHHMTTLADTIQFAMDHLNVTSSSINDVSLPTFPIPERAEESKKIFSAIMNYVRTGVGHCLYLPGVTGMGKSASVFSSVGYARDYCLEHGVEFFGMSLNGNQAGDKTSLVSRVSEAIGCDADEKLIAKLNPKSHPEIPTHPQYEEVPMISSDISISSGSGRKSNFQKKGSLVVLIIDEMDKLGKSTLPLVLKWSLSGNLLVIGTGNNGGALNGIDLSLGLDKAVVNQRYTQIPFAQYNEQQLNSIVMNKMGPLMKEATVDFYVKKIISHYKGDARPLFTNLQGLLNACTGQPGKLTVAGIFFISICFLSNSSSLLFC